MSQLVTASESDTPEVAALRAGIAALAEGDFRRRIHEADLLVHLGMPDLGRDMCHAFIADHAPQVAEDSDLFDVVLSVAFRTRDLDGLADYLRTIYGARVEFRFESVENSFNMTGVVRWTLNRDGSAAFTFQDNIFVHPYLDVIVRHWGQELPLLLYYQGLPDVPPGEVLLSVEDHGTLPGLMYCGGPAPEFHLIPDPIFLAGNGYEEVKRTYGSPGIPWQERRPTAFWRGTTTGWHDCRGEPLEHWRDLPRIRLCELGTTAAGADLLDVGITGVVQVEDPSAVAEVERSGLMKRPTPWRDFQARKLQIDIDGNTNSWPGLFMKLATGSPVLKVASPGGFRQWFYDRLIPWYNFVPVAADLSDLLDKVAWLLARDEVAHQIGRNGQLLADSMTKRGEMVLAERTIRAAFAQAGADRRDAWKQAVGL